MPWAAAHDRFAEAVGAGYGASYNANVIQGLQKATLDGYLRQVRRLARMERMRPGMGARMVLETRLMEIVNGEQSESAAKLVLSAARLVEKMGWAKPVVRVANWYLVEALESRRTKEERSAAKEWAQVGDLVSLCASARSFTDWEAVALACISVAHCMRRSEAGGTVGQSDDGVRFFGSKSRRGEQNQDVGPWCKEWLVFLGKLRALKGFHPHKGAWHGSGDALGKSLVELLERGGRGRGLRWHSFRRLGAAQLRKSGAPMQTVLLWGGVEIPRSRQAVYRRPPTVEIRAHGRNTVAGVGGSGRENAPVHGPQGIDTCVLAILGAGGNCICPKRRFTTCWEWVHGGGGGKEEGTDSVPSWQARS